MSKLQNAMKQSESLNQKGRLHHARYFQRKVEEKQVRDLKKQVLLRKGRNSKVLRVTSMQDVKQFDKHIERCLIVKQGDEDSAMKRAVQI